MHILAIIGSPRKQGNTAQVVAAVEQALIKNPGVTVEYLYLADTYLGSCIGCHVCIFKDEAKCPLHDDRDMILEKMKQADGLIFAAPVYVFQVPALVKNLIDHLAFVCHRPVFFSKYAMVITTTGGGGEKIVNKYMQQILSVWGYHIGSTLSLQTPPTEPIEQHINKNQQKINDAAQKFYKKLSAGAPTSAKFMSIVLFRILRKITFSYPDVFEADVKYYTPLRNSNYFIQTRVPVMKRGVAWLFEKIVFR